MSSANERAERGNVRQIALDKLTLDPSNPRLPPPTPDSPKSQVEIALFINRHYDPLRIAASIAEHQFFESEPLIAVPDGDEFKVIEGNRRLTALKGLADADLRAEFAKENSGWNRLPDAELPGTIPVLVVSDASDVAPLLGFRHISGIEPWDPYAQARYIAQLVDRDGNTLEEVAELVGRTRTEVRSKYRDYDILNQADGLGIDTKRARQAFGVFNNAMGRRAIRAFIAAPDPRSVDPSHLPLPDSSRENLDLLLRIIFGDARGSGRIITDSRQLGQLAQVLAEPSERALRVLLSTKDLQAALDAASNPAEQFARAIRLAKSELEKAVELGIESMSESDRASISRIRRLARTLLRGDEDVQEE